MYAIVEIAGQQFKVQKDQKIYVHRLDAEAGKKIDFDKVLLIEDGGKVTLGAPAINGAVVSAKVEEHVKGDKVIVFRKKRRKGYAKKNGHRQSFTAITISDIKVGGAKAEKKEKEAAPAEPKAEKKPAAKKATKKADTTEE
jgi:large subunit ribosomal protein L21